MAASEIGWLLLWLQTQPELTRGTKGGPGQSLRRVLHRGLHAVAASLLRPVLAPGVRIARCREEIEAFLLGECVFIKLFLTITCSLVSASCFLCWHHV